MDIKQYAPNKRYKYNDIKLQIIIFIMSILINLINIYLSS